jgi:hypothetical protein
MAWAQRRIQRRGRRAVLDPRGIVASIPEALDEWPGQRWSVAPGQCFGNGRHVGNRGSASIWVVLDALLQWQQLCPGCCAWFLGAEATQYRFDGFVLHDDRRAAG